MIGKKPVLTVAAGGARKEAQANDTRQGDCISVKVRASFLFPPGDKGECLGHREARRMMNRVALAG